MIGTAKRESTADRKEFSLERSAVFALGALTFARPWHVVPCRWLPRGVFLAVMTAGSFVFWHWEAMLISFLAVKTTVLPFATLTDLMSSTDLK